MTFDKPCAVFHARSVIPNLACAHPPGIIEQYCLQVGGVRCAARCNMDLSLAPGFSRVKECRGAFNRFSGLLDSKNR